MGKRLKKLKKEKGITLIALVITIIVLLILAAVSIATLTGENGILNRASNAREQTEQATEEEQRQLAMAEAAMNLENTEYNGVTIPAGFAPTRIEGENSVEDGLVIIDSEGNEFVWIPVRDEETYRRNDSYKNYKFAQADADYLPNDLVKNHDSDEEKIERELVVSAGGFYVGRYEAGVDGDISIIDVERNTTLFLEW